MRNLFEISRSGLRNAERSLSVTANNIVNADTPGYTRQRVDNAPVGMQMDDYHAGLGVSITGVNRLRNEMNDVLLNAKHQQKSYLQEKANIFSRLEASMVSDSGADLDYNMGRLFDAFSELSADSQDMSVRHNVISEASQLVSKFRSMSHNFDRTSELVRESAASTVGSINNLLKDLGSLNHTIQQAEALDNPDHASKDVRVEKLNELSQLVDFETQKTGKGALEVYIGGVKVVGTDEASQITSEVDDINKRYRLRLESGKSIQVSGGKLGAEIEMYEKELPELKERLDLLASTVVEEVNALHKQGFGLVDYTARNFFQPGVTRASEIRLNEALIKNPRHIAASSVDGEAGNGEMAARIAELKGQNLLDNRKIVDYTVDLISSPGKALYNLNSDIKVRNSEIQMLHVQQESAAGVNVDEELSQMIKYQNAYQGAARVMSSAQKMYDTLMSITR